MGLVTICKYKRAETPFFAEQAGLNLYSLEELAYFLYHNVCLVDRQFFDDRLCRWIDADAGCPKLARQLESYIASGKSFSQMVLLVTGTAGLYTSRELAGLEERLRSLGSLQEQERMKMRADELLNNRNEWSAMEEYRRILQMHQNSRLGMAFYGAVWNNLGVCYARQFLFEEAADCFETSYEYHPDEEVEAQAELARQLSSGQRPGGRRKKPDFTNPQRQLLKWEQEYRAKQKR